MQTLTGDKTDGYPGLEGIGPVKADKILKEGTYEEVLQAYRNAGFNDEFALSQARCARILRHGEYDWATKEIKLWNP
jgi:DNA polymerase-1